jgi:selenocysteine lyase/cysteine desulfurase
MKFTVIATCNTFRIKEGQCTWKTAMCVAASFRKLRRGIGLEVQYTLATGERTRRIYLDSTASTLRLKVVQAVLDKFQPYYSNTHSLLHFGARLSTKEYQWAHEMVLEFVRANPEIYTTFFAGSGTTAGINRVARTLREKRPERDLVITTIMEHHSNDLPHRKHFREVVHIPAAMAAHSLGCVNLPRLEEALRSHADKVNYVAITGVSNVTGILNPVHEIAALAHQYGALHRRRCRADGGTADPNERACRPGRDIDVLIFPDTKFTRPALWRSNNSQRVICRLEPQEVGGGMVDQVYINRYTQSQKFRTVKRRAHQYLRRHRTGSGVCASQNRHGSHRRGRRQAYRICY